MKTIITFFFKLLNQILPCPNFYTISHGEYGGEEMSGYKLIKKKEDLPEGLIDFDFDFRHNHLLLLSLGTRNTGGYSITVIKVERWGCTLHVHYTVQSPLKGQLVTHALTNPYHLISIPKFNKICTIKVS